VTTGTLTEAMPLRPGDKWSVTLRGLDLPGIDVAFIG
jgi:2-oxo-3-hexenedioate decarboxylase